MEAIQDTIKQTEDKIKSIKEMKELLSTYEDYQGEDKVASYSELAKEFEQLPKEEGIKTGIPSLDNKTTGFRFGNLNVISGTTGTGKTTLLQTFVKNLSQEKYPTLFFTYEVPPMEFLKKFEDGIPNFAYLPRQHKSSKLDWLEERILEGISKYDTKIIMIDHLHFLLDMKMMAGGNTSLLIGAVMRELKRMAIQYNIIIFLIAHTKQTKFLKGQMPDLTSLRDSGMVAAESDFVLFIDRKQTEDKMNWDDKSVLFLAKNRWNGQTGWVHLVFKNNKFIEEDYAHSE